MEMFKSTLEFIRFVRQLKAKKYLIIYGYDRLSKTYKTETELPKETYEEALKKCRELISSGQTIEAKIVMEITLIKTISKTEKTTSAKK